MNPYNFSTLLFAFNFLLIGFLVVLSRNNRLTRSYFIYSVLVTGWAIPYSVSIGDNASYEISLLAMRISNLNSLFIGSAFYYFCLTFSKRKNDKILFFLNLFAIGIFFFGFTDWFIPDLKSILNFKYYPNPGPLYYVFAIIFHVGVFFGFKLLYQGYQLEKGFRKKQYFGLLISAIFGYLGGSLSFLPVFNLAVPQWGLFLMPLYPFLMAYFIMRENLFNEEEMILAAHKDKLAMLGTIASSINHEVKTPLYVIEGLASSHQQNLKDGLYHESDEEKKLTDEILTKICAQTKRAVEIMRDFSNFAKAHVDSNEKEEIVLKELVDSVLPLLSYEAETRTIKIYQKVPLDLALVRAGQHGLEQIVFNLVVNACHANKGEDGFVELSAIELGNDKIQLTIKDNGPGIPRSIIGQIFEPFYTTKKEGTGLGLYITKQLVERSGGKIKVESKEGKGTTFTIELPRA